MTKVTSFIIAMLFVPFLAGCAAPPPVRVASSVLGRTVLKKAKDQYQQNHPEACPTPEPTPQDATSVPAISQP